MRKPTKLGFAGAVMGSLGVVCIVWGSVEEFDPVRVGIGLFLAGVVSVCFKKLEEQLLKLREKNLAADEIYKLAHDRGIEEGYEEGYHEGMINGERRRPAAVVPLPHCPDCGAITTLRSVAGNRG